jgi:hypothetical protein
MRWDSPASWVFTTLADVRYAVSASFTWSNRISGMMLARARDQW